MKFVVQKEEKLAPFLRGRLNSSSNKEVRRLLEANLCRINGKIERFGSKRLLKGAIVELSQIKEIKRDKSPKPLFENDAFLIINKPKGFTCDPKNVAKEIGKGLFLVHRLDKDTTGLFLIAKTKEAEQNLTLQFRNRTIYKSYLALVDGVIRKEKGVEHSYFIKKGSFAGQTIWGSSSIGIEAITKWEKIEEYQNATLVRCEPLTGRTHQIRVHMKEMGHPILIDPQYAKNYRSKLISSRPLLHAERLCFTYQTEFIDIKAPLSLDFQEAIDSLGTKA